MEEPWNQRQIRDAIEGTRTSSIRFDSSGKYLFELYRWPKEDGGSIDGTDSKGKGIALKTAVKAHLEIADVGEWTKII